MSALYWCYERAAAAIVGTARPVRVVRRAQPRVTARNPSLARLRAAGAVPAASRMGLVCLRVALPLLALPVAPAPAYAPPSPVPAFAAPLVPLGGYVAGLGALDGVRRELVPLGSLDLPHPAMTAAEHQDVPEPGSALLLAAGLGCLALARRAV